EMWGTFNMGIGFVVVVNKEDEEAVLSKLQEMNEKAYTIGYIGKTSGGDSKICLK
ncbi:MAG: phosphoribosylformylglycinamidine cyclo-ligase, partial [Leptotrichiaceae bacterium]|nr:phosphoribosylformylglycinamidine cyclo-ligase [Leptotrichiaceae bacterium]